MTVLTLYTICGNEMNDNKIILITLHTVSLCIIKL